MAGVVQTEAETTCLPSSFQLGLRNKQRGLLREGFSRGPVQLYIDTADSLLSEFTHLSGPGIAVGLYR